MIDIQIDVDDSLVQFGEDLGFTTFFLGLLAGISHLVWPHPLLPRAASVMIVCGLGVGMLCDTDHPDDIEPPAARAHPVGIVGVLAALVGVAMFPIAALTTQPFRQTSVAGAFLLIAGLGLAMVFGGFEDDTPTDPTVPDDPTDMLEDEP